MSDFVYGLTSFIEQSGRYIPVADVLSDYVYGLIWWIVLFGSTLCLPIRSEKKRLLMVGWIMKLVLCMVLMLPYESQYSVLDAFTYVKMARTFSFSDLNLGIGFGYYAPVALTHVLLKIVGDSFHAIKLVYAYIGLLGTLFVAQAASRATGVRLTRCFFTLICFPSILFWTSILGKDPLLHLGLGLYLYGAVRWREQRNGRSVVIALVGAAIIAFVRIWVGLMFTATFGLLAVLASGHRLPVVPRKRLWLTATGLALGGALFVASGQLDRLSNTYNEVDTKWEHRDSTVDISIDRSSMVAMAEFLPIGFSISLFAPFPVPGMVHNAFTAVASAESVGLLGIAFWLLLASTRRTRHSPLVIWGAATVIMWGALYAFVSYKDLGAAVRYRTQILPLFAIGLLAALHEKAKSRYAPKVSHRLPRAQQTPLAAKV